MENENIAAALARIEEQLKHLTEKLDRAIARTDVHEDTLSKHEARLAVLESRSGGWKTVIAIVSPIVAALAFGIAILDRLYG
jgi:uncharacterized coiled-coil protein SlyX